MKQAVAKFVNRVTGWKPVLAQELPRKCVLIAAPHTSNWDAFHLLALAIGSDIQINWVAKDTAFKPPLGWLIARMGAIPVNRRERTNMVSQMVQLFAEHDELVLTVPAEGTRARADHWKSGFYHIAQEAGVPIVLGFLDYGKKQGGFGPIIQPGGKLVDDMNTIRAFYSDIEAKIPALVGPIQLKAEVQTDAQAPKPGGAG